MNPSSLNRLPPNLARRSTANSTNNAIAAIVGTISFVISSGAVKLTNPAIANANKITPTKSNAECDTGVREGAGVVCINTVDNSGRGCVAPLAGLREGRPLLEGKQPIAQRVG